MASTTKKVLTGVGIAAAAAAALAGVYFLYGTKEGAVRRKKIKSWVLKMKGDVLEELENLKVVNQEVYEKTVDAVTNKYAQLKHVAPPELAKVAKELKGYWLSMQRELAARRRTKKK